jgi:hypothetical protein
MKEKFDKLNNLFVEDIKTFDREIAEMTSNMLNDYLSSQKTDRIFEHFKIRHPRFLIQALWARDFSVKNSIKFTSSHDRNLLFPSDFDPDEKMKK